MTREEIMAMAREAGLKTERMNQYPAELWEIVRFAALVAAKEREKCIDLVAFHGGSVEIEASMRARGQA